MKVIDKTDGTVVGEITTNRSMTIDEAMELIGCPWVTNDDTDESGYLVNGIYYDQDDLIMEY